MVAPFSKFYGKICVGFCLNTRKRFFLEVNIGSSKNGTRDFQNSLPFERSAWFYVTITGNFERFQYFNFSARVLGNESLFQKIGVPFFS